MNIYIYNINKARAFRLDVKANVYNFQFYRSINLL